MQPENQQPNYDFIFNSSQQNKKGALAGAGKGKRIAIVVGGGFILLMLIIIIFSLIFGGGGADKQLTLRMAQQHTELIRITEIGEEKARGQAAKNLATTTRLTLQSAESDIVAIAGSGQKVDAKVLALGKDAATDKTLTEAEQRSQFDEVFTEVVSEELTAYRSDLERAFNSSKSAKNKQLYSNLHEQLGDIIDTASGVQN